MIEVFLYYTYIFLRIYFYVMILYIILSWTPLVNSKFYSVLRKIVDPYLGIFRGLFVFGSMDFTPIVGLLLYQFLLMMIERVLFV
ncbi:MAG: YggT family protein [Tenericutes bacterium]|jgi:YggT family protein|nr:YggT family protein [Mycoplasmatota bacterium]